MKKVIFYKQDIGYAVENPNKSYGIVINICILMFDMSNMSGIKEYVEEYNSGSTSGDLIYVEFDKDNIIIGDAIYMSFPDIGIEEKIKMRRNDFINLSNFWQSLEDLEVSEIELKVDDKKVYVSSGDLHFETEYILLA